MNGEPGNTLRRIREERAYSQEEVAEKLHLSVGKVIALENCDYHSLPEATYVRGYIRNYAQLLEIDPVPLVAAYDDQIVKKKKERHQNEVAVEAASRTPQISGNNQTIMAIAGIVVVVGIGLGFWIYSASQKPAGKADVSTSETGTQRYESTVMEDTALVEEQKLDLPQGDVDDPIVAGAAEVPGTGLTEPAGQSAESGEQGDAKQEQSRPNETARVESEPAPAEAESVTSEAQQPAAVAAPRTNEAVPAEATPVAQDELVLIFEMDSWADVRDASDRKLLYKTVSAGRVVSMKGQAPFQVFIGNADGVKLSLNGQQIDFSPYRRGLIARFTVGRKPGQPLQP